MTAGMASVICLFAAVVISGFGENSRRFSPLFNPNELE